MTITDVAKADEVVGVWVEVGLMEDGFEGGIVTVDIGSYKGSHGEVLDARG